VPLSTEIAKPETVSNASRSDTGSMPYIHSTLSGKQMEETRGGVDEKGSEVRELE